MTLTDIKFDKAALEQVLIDAGATVSATSVNCPFHSDSTASAGLFIGEDHTWRFKCHSCDAAGDIVDITQRIYDEDFASACARLGIKNASGTIGGNGCTQTYPKLKVARDWATEQARYRDAMNDDRLNELADRLGVRADAIKSIGTGWCGAQQCWTFPEYGADGTVIGINRRFRAGQKRFFQGGKRGLTIPGNLSSILDPVLVVEGASDTVACLSVGITAVGRPNNTGGAELLAELLEGREIIVVADDDESGRRGAAKVTQYLANNWNKVVRWSLPPDGSKDIRAFLSPYAVNDTHDSALRQVGASLLNEITNSAVGVQPEATPEKSSEPKMSQATMLTHIAISEAELFHDLEGNGYATITVNGHGETHALRSRAFRDWLARKMYTLAGKCPGGQATQDALTTIGGHARYEGATIETHIRVAEHGDKIYLDLADEKWRAVEIDKDGWRIVDSPPVKFVRSKSMKPLPLPVAGGSVDELRQFVNVANDSDFILLIGFMVMALRPIGPWEYPILEVSGEQGSGKSTASRMIRSLIDPNMAPLRSAPRTEQDLLIQATNGWLVGLDNLSRISGWLSDSLCRLSSGGGHSARELYTNGEDFILVAKRPIIVNGIESVVERPDLMGRRVSILLPRIPETMRRRASEVWNEFNQAAPRILGALLDGLSCGLRNIATTELSDVPRMADFATWCEAAAPSFGWDKGRFLYAYTGNRADATEQALDASIVATVFRRWAKQALPWSGTASELLTQLTTEVGEDAAKRKGWPTQAHRLSGTLRRYAPNLRAVGIEIEFPDKGGTRGRIFTVTDCSGTHQERSDDSQASHENQPGAIENGDWNARNAKDADLHTLSKKVPETTLVPSGWTPAAFATNLERMAGLCEDNHPDRAAELRQRAKQIRGAVA